MSESLSPMLCRLCGVSIEPSCTDVGVRANSYKECFYRCYPCGVAYSNAKSADARTLIYKDWRRNIPKEVHAGLLDCIRTSLNERSRCQKANRLAFESSEDAVSWTVFRFLQQEELLGKVLELSEARVLFWGAEYPLPTNPTENITQTLRQVLSNLGEHPNRFSEPDIMLISPQEIRSIEVKYLSSNSRQRDYKNFDRYLQAEPDLFLDADAVRRAGFYELTRNVVIACRLAKTLGRDKWRVTNLGGQRCRVSASEFQKLLRNPDHFQYQSWRDFCGRIQYPSPHFAQYLQQKKLGD